MQKLGYVLGRIPERLNVLLEVALDAPDSFRSVEADLLRILTREPLLLLSERALQGFPRSG